MRNRTGKARPSFWQSLFKNWRGGNHRERGVRGSIAALIEKADHPGNLGAAPELDRQERALLYNVLHLRGKTADDVMIPRADIVALSASVDHDAALDFMRRENHSRVPVFDGELDHIIGMIHVKDLIAYQNTGGPFPSGICCDSRFSSRLKYRFWTCCFRCARGVRISRWSLMNMAVLTGS